MPSTFIPIQKLTVTLSGTTTLQFLNIPQTYTDLVIRGSIRSDRTDSTQETLTLRFANQTNSVYSRQQLRLNDANSTVVANQQVNQAQLNLPTMASSAGSTHLSPIEIYISRYNELRQRAGWAEASVENGGTGSTTRSIYAFRFANTNAQINRIDLYMGTGSNWGVGSTLTLYGIKNS